MRRQIAFVPFGRGEGNVTRNRQAREEERARGGQAFEPGQPVEVLDPHSQAWAPGRFVEPRGDFVRVAIDGKPAPILIVKERIRPRSPTENP